METRTQQFIKAGVRMRVRGSPDCQEPEDFIQDVFRFTDNLNLALMRIGFALCECPVDDFPGGINGFCQAIGAVMAESKLRETSRSSKTDLVDPKAVYPLADEAIRRATGQTQNRRWALLESFGESLLAR